MQQRSEVIHAQRAIAAEDQTIVGLLVMLDVGGRSALLVRLGADGGVQRLGSGSIETLERDRFIGALDPEIFRGLSSTIGPSLLSWCGQSRSHPSPRGELCDLVIAFRTADGRELSMAWRYGTHSKWPPPEVLEFVEEAVRATEPWYQDQKRELVLQTQRAEYEWWPIMSLPSHEA
jgi:hypothetical protein